MSKDQSNDLSKNSPGSLSGTRDNDTPHEQERVAVKKEASHPGSIANAAGMHGDDKGKDRANIPLDWGDGPLSAMNDRED